MPGEEEGEEESEPVDEGGKERGAQFATRPVGTMPSSSSEEEEDEEDEDEEEEEEVGDATSEVYRVDYYCQCTIIQCIHVLTGVKVGVGVSFL